MAQNSIGVTLKCKKGTAESYVELPNLQSVPSLGGSNSAIDITTLADTFEKKMPGIKSYGDSLGFVFLFDSGETDSSFDTLSAIENAQEETAFRVELPDGTTFDFSALVTVSLNEIGTNTAIQFTANLMPQSKIEIGSSKA